MVWVNLLPWRQTEHLRRWRFWRLMGVLVMLLLCTLALNGQWLRRLNQQQAITLAQWVSAQHEAAALNERWLAVKRVSEEQQKLVERHLLRQQQLTLWVTFSRMLGALFPSDVWLTSLNKTPQSLEMAGVGKRIQPLYELRQRLAEIPSLTPVVLGPLKRTRTGEITFNMQTELVATGVRRR
ncbi:hypothetical protein CI789_20235 [Erwinia persicina]|uniref:PilN domain-containing protein n=1 Tax=Erwinia persicina TaxID=55211 RepID=UPI000788C533|nr:hypothetical protein [Erwinia persicina]AXU97322.1 hypothetical protein CI789_20235 [Erwinia persicina]MBC3947828.1 fimbrial assembly protein [Erwinia persicina]